MVSAALVICLVGVAAAHPALQDVFDRIGSIVNDRSGNDAVVVGAAEPPATGTTPCLQELKDGSNTFCRAHMEKWYFNSSEKKCEKFFFRGCGGNDNRFDTQAKCEKKCPTTTKDICKLPMVRGVCRAAHERYFFNTIKGRCEYFAFGGCGGNKNNFKTMEECEKACN